MAGGVASILRDNDPLIEGTHGGAAGLSIVQAQKDFKSTGAASGLAVQNVTAETFGHIVSITEEAVLTDITFNPGDSYEIYKTATYNSVISVHYEDRRFGLKVTNKNELINGLFPEDRDVDEDGSKIFAPGQPWQEHI